MSNEQVHEVFREVLDALTPQVPRHESVGVMKFCDGWRVYWRGQMDDQPFATRLAAIDELAARDRAERFCEAEAR